MDAKFLVLLFMVILGDEEEHLVRVSDIVMQETNCTQF
jgi:hypothetical protein